MVRGRGTILQFTTESTYVFDIRKKNRSLNVTCGNERKKVYSLSFGFPNLHQIKILRNTLIAALSFGEDLSLDLLLSIIPSIA